MGRVWTVTARGDARNRNDTLRFMGKSDGHPPLEQSACRTPSSLLSCPCDPGVGFSFDSNDRIDVASELCMVRLHQVPSDH